MISGELTGLRALESDDLPQLRDWRNIPTFRKHFREHRELGLGNQYDWYEKTLRSPNDFMFLVVDLNTGEPIGACGLLYTNWIIRAADFSFYIGRDNVYIDTEGYALDAARSLIKYGFNELNLNKVWMELYEYDSKKLNFFINELGFIEEGKLRQNCFSNGRYWDSFIISLLQHDWHTNHNAEA